MPSAPANREVFVNCPFDSAYTELFYALMFTIYDCGFQPRCAKDKEVPSGGYRLPKICDMIAACPLGIHDISRTDSPRFNMPLELGVFLGHREYKDKKKGVLILDKSKLRYRRLCSDLSGIDVEAHHDRPRDLVWVVRDWLRMNQEVPEIIPDGRDMFERYAQFMIERPSLCKRLRLRIQGILYTDYLTVVEAWLLENDWRPSPSPTLPQLLRPSRPA